MQRRQHQQNEDNDAALSITLMVTIAFFALNGVSDAGASNDALYTPRT
jgi:hypothetical protein